MPIDLTVLHRLELQVPPQIREVFSTLVNIAVAAEAYRAVFRDGPVPYRNPVGPELQKLFDTLDGAMI